MITKIILFLTVVLYSVIASQSLMYILALKNVQLSLRAEAYIEFRKLINSSMKANFKYVVYGALLTNLLLVIFTGKNPSSLLFITTLVAFACLVIDTLITVKGNMPINTVINTWSSDSYPTNWNEYRLRWLTLFKYRQIVNLTGFTSLLIGTVFSGK